MVNGKTELKGMKPIEFNVNFCKWMKNPRVGYIITIFKHFFQDFLDPKMLECPVKKGKYVFMKARELFSGVKANGGFLPTGFLLQGNVTFTVIIKGRIDNKMQLLARIVEILEF
jgi:hypothetical protein